MDWRDDSGEGEILLFLIISLIIPVTLGWILLKILV